MRTFILFFMMLCATNTLQAQSWLNLNNFFYSLISSAYLTQEINTPTCPFSSAAPIYVDTDATGNNDGTSWADAFTDLQPALDAYCNNADIWVAEGTYLPTESPDETTSDARNKAFHFDTDIKIYGGFDGTETMLTQRDASANPTILSGDFNNDDVVTGGGSTLSITNNTENAYHVLVTINLSNAAILDGFAIQGGNTDGTSGIAYGGLNISPEGGGMYNFSSSPTLTNVTFSQNNAGSQGGGMYNFSSSSPTLTNVTFSQNNAGSRGGGMYNYFSSSPTLTNVTFSQNNAGSDGGGMYNENNSSPTLTNVTFSQNNASFAGGGGMYNLSSSPTLTNVTFSQNNASFAGGGGMYNENNSSPTLTNVTFSQNNAGSEGGGMYNSFSSPTLYN